MIAQRITVIVWALTNSVYAFIRIKATFRSDAMHAMRSTIIVKIRTGTDR